MRRLGTLFRLVVHNREKTEKREKIKNSGRVISFKLVYTNALRQVLIRLHSDVFCNNKERITFWLNRCD